MKSILLSQWFQFSVSSEDVGAGSIVRFILRLGWSRRSHFQDGSFTWLTSWWMALVRQQVHLSTGLLEHPHGEVGDFPRESDLKEQDRGCHGQSPLTIPRRYKQNLGNKKANLFIPFEFTWVSLSSRVPRAEALQLALQTRVP